VAVHSPSGRQVTTWGELHRRGLAARRWAAEQLSGGDRVVLAMDNSAASVAAFAGLTAAGHPIVCVDPDGAGPGSGAPSRSGVTPWEVVVDPRVAVADAASRGRPDRAPALRSDGDVAVFQLSSGSTGPPRLVRQTVSACVRGGRIYRDLHGYRPADRVFAGVPIAHSFGLVGGMVAAVVSGAELVLLSRFSPAAAGAVLTQGVDVLLGTPLVHRLLAQAWLPGSLPRGVRVALSSGGPMEAAVADGAQRLLGTPVRQVYGSTETGLVACQFDRPEPWPPGCVGVAAPGVSWQTREDEQGGKRLLVRTSTMFDGYLDPDGRELGPNGPPGLFDTGDLVELDPAGHLFVVARKATFINVGGRKVNPLSVESLIREHPAVRDAHVLGAARHGEQEVQAVVVLRPGTDVETLLRFCRTRLARHEGPHRVHVVDRIPRTGMGKVDSTALRGLLKPHSGPGAGPGRPGS